MRRLISNQWDLLPTNHKPTAIPRTNPIATTHIQVEGLELSDVCAVPGAACVAEAEVSETVVPALVGKVSAGCGGTGELVAGRIDAACGVVATISGVTVEIAEPSPVTAG